jgi:phasin family protein
MASNPRQAERDSSETSRETTRKAAEQAAHAGAAMADVGERTARTGAEAIQRNAESVTNTWRNGSEAASRIAERSVDQFSKMFGLTGETAMQTVQRSGSNIQAVMESAMIFASGLQDVSGEWLRFAQNRVEQNLDHFDRLLECRSPQEYLALQTQVVRDNFEAILQSAHRTSERSTQVADEAVQRMSESSLAPR